MTARTLAWGLGLALLTACPGYNPEFVDCKVKCSPKGACPAGRECKGGFCRPPNTMTNCDCSPGAQRPCGGGLGLCVPGVQSCSSAGSWGACLGEGKPTSELCDNKDNDCNGTVDEDVVDAPPCPKTQGVCASTLQKCLAGAYSGTCTAADYGLAYEDVETKCDNLDNDCNGQVDSTAPVSLMSDVSEFVLAEYDGGFSIVAVEEPATGGYQVVLLRLTDTLVTRGAVVPISAPALPGTLNLAARTVPGGTTFVAWAPRAVDAGVNLSAVDSNGIVSQFPPYLTSEKDGELSLGVNASKVLVSWPAHFGVVARLVTWDLVDGGISARDFGRFADGGYNELN
ncbi:MAG: hypothetical protein H6Q89_4067, partial [Myxococcaceae bacterium]|nr:hypothetical protein [Myxococcaceae bacterium]